MEFGSYFLQGGSGRFSVLKWCDSCGALNMDDSEVCISCGAASLRRVGEDRPTLGDVFVLVDRLVEKVNPDAVDRGAAFTGILADIIPGADDEIGLIRVAFESGAVAKLSSSSSYKSPSSSFCEKLPGYVSQQSKDVLLAAFSRIIDFEYETGGIPDNTDGDCQNPGFGQGERYTSDVHKSDIGGAGVESDVRGGAGAKPGAADNMPEGEATTGPGKRLILFGYGDSKIQVIKCLRELSGMSLKGALQIVDKSEKIPLDITELVIGSLQDAWIALEEAGEYLAKNALVVQVLQDAWIALEEAGARACILDSEKAQSFSTIKSFITALVSCDEPELEAANDDNTAVSPERLEELIEEELTSDDNATVSSGRLEELMEEFKRRLGGFFEIC